MKSLKAGGCRKWNCGVVSARAAIRYAAEKIGLALSRNEKNGKKIGGCRENSGEMNLVEEIIRISKMGQVIGSGL